MKRSGTSRRPPRRDVPNVATLGQLLRKSTSGNVVTLQRRDVSASSAFPALKENGGANLEASGDTTRQGTEIRAGVTGSRRRAVIRTFLYFGILDLLFMISHMDIFSVIMF